MVIPEFVHLKLRQTFGPEAAEFFVTWMEGVDSNRADIAELRHEMQVGFARLEARIDQSVIRTEARIDQSVIRTEAMIEKRTAEVLKWSFVFWVGAVTSIAILAKLLP